MVKTSFNSSIAGLALVLCLGVAGLDNATAQTTTLVLSGDTAPDGNGTFSSFELMLPLNTNGKVAFIANLTGTQNPSSDGRGIFVADTKSIIKLVRTGEPAPDGNGTFNHFANDYGVLERLVLNDNDSVAFMANLAGTSGNDTDNIGLFGAKAASGIKQFVRVGDNAPDGNGDFTATLSTPGLDNNDRAMFYGTLINTSGGEHVDDSGAFRSDGNTVTQLIRAGETVPGGGDTFESITPGISSNLGGHAAISTSLTFDFMGGPPPEDLQRTYVHNGAALKEVLRSGTSVPDGNGIVGGAQSLGINSVGNVVFVGSVSDSDDWRLDVPRLFITDGVTLRQIASQNEVAPGEQVGPGELPFRFGSIEEFNRDFNIHGKVAFSVILERNATPPDNRSSGIYLGDGNTTKLVLHQGDAVPDGNGTFGKVAVPLFLNNRGEIVFASSLEGTSNPSSDDKGIFLIGSDGVVQTVARRGMPLAGSTIYDTAFLGDALGIQFGFDPFNSDLSAGGMSAVNDSGQVAFWAALTDGRSGIFLWKSSTTPPEDDTIYTDSFE